MTTPQELTALAAAIADDLDTMANLPAHRITHIAIGQPDPDKPERVQFTLGDGFQHPTPELQTKFAATAKWLRETLPTLDTSGADLDDDDVYERFYPEQVAEVLGTKLLVDADVVAYWVPAELGSVLANRDTAVMYTLAATFAVAWEDYLGSDQPHLKMQIDLATERANRHDVDAIESQLRILARRDDLIKAAIAAGISKNRIHTLTGISRSTIDRLLAATEAIKELGHSGAEAAEALKKFVKTQGADRTVND